MKVPDMIIYLTENNVPFRVSTARQVPLRFQEAANKTISDLLSAGVIAKEAEPQPWCAPGFWVPKPDGKRVRLVTDYTKPSFSPRWMPSMGTSTWLWTKLPPSLLPSFCHLADIGIYRVTFISRATCKNSCIS